jgi:acyl dehydratase
MNSYNMEELKSWIGREVIYTAPEVLGAASIRYFALALGDENPLFRDEAYGRTTRHGSMIAPPTLVCETNQFFQNPPDENGYIGHFWALPFTSNRFIRGENEYEFHQPVRADDRITVKVRLVDICERQTKSAGVMIFVVSEAQYTNQRGELLAVNRETNIHQL